MAHKTVQETIEYYVKEKGMTKPDAIKKVERILHCKLPDTVLRTMEGL